MAKAVIEKAHITKQTPATVMQDLEGVVLGQIEEIKTIETRRAPFLAYLEEAKRVRDVDSAIVVYRYLDYTQSDAATVVAEGGAETDIVEPVASTKEVRMSIYRTGVRVSHLAQVGSAPEVDLLQSAVEDAITQLVVLREKSIIKSTGIPGERNLTFSGLYEQISEKSDRVFTADLSKGDLILDKIDDAIIDLEEKEGTQPTVILTHSKVMKAMTDEIKNDEAYQFMVSDLDDVIPGITVTGLRTATGTKVPVIESPNAPTDTVYILDENSFHYNMLMRETFFQIPQVTMDFYGPIIAYGALAVEFPSRNRLVTVKTS